MTSDRRGDVLFERQEPGLGPRSPAEAMAWDIYYASICAMALHPGFRGEPDYARMAYHADLMLLERRKRGV